jgi:hypothetical protein
MQRLDQSSWSEKLLLILVCPASTHTCVRVRTHTYTRMHTPWHTHTHCIHTGLSVCNLSVSIWFIYLIEIDSVGQIFLHQSEIAAPKPCCLRPRRRMGALRSALSQCCCASLWCKCVWARMSPMTAEQRFVQKPMAIVWFWLSLSSWKPETTRATRDCERLHHARASRLVKTSSSSPPFDSDVCKPVQPNDSDVCQPVQSKALFPNAVSPACGWPCAATSPRPYSRRLPSALACRQRKTSPSHLARAVRTAWISSHS